MKRSEYIWFLIIAVLMTGLALLPFIIESPTRQESKAVAGPRVIMETLDPSLEWCAPLWRDEIGRRFDNSVGILVHGGDVVQGQWIAGTAYAPHRHATPLRDIVLHYKALYPGRTIVVLACNPGHLPLGIPGVYYAHSNVWCVPDRSLTADMFRSTQQFARVSDAFAFFYDLDERRGSRWEIEPDVVGNIFEFATDAP